MHKQSLKHSASACFFLSLQNETITVESLTSSTRQNKTSLLFIFLPISSLHQQPLRCQSYYYITSPPNLQTNKTKAVIHLPTCVSLVRPPPSMNWQRSSTDSVGYASTSSLTRTFCAAVPGGRRKKKERKRLCNHPQKTIWWEYFNTFACIETKEELEQVGQQR